MLTDRTDRQTDPAQVERAFLKWASEHRLATSHGIPRAQFVQNALTRIGLRPLA